MAVHESSIVYTSGSALSEETKEADVMDVYYQCHGGVELRTSALCVCTHSRALPFPIPS
jgi:hypothetical protein